MDLEAGKSHLIETTTINTDNINNPFVTPINKFREFNYDTTCRLEHEGEEYVFPMNSDMTVLELVENISKHLNTILTLLNTV